MGGGGSKPTPVETEDQRPAYPHPVKGLKNGDVVTVKGEAFAGFDKFLAVYFYNGDDVAFMFKAVLLEAEGVSNTVKLNYRSNGEWGPGQRIENVIYLNHFFEVKFTCLDDKFTVDIDGNHFGDFQHHVSPDKIDNISLAGDANWSPIELPNSEKRAAEYNGPFQLPNPDEVKLFMQSLRQHRPRLCSAPTADDGKELEKLITEGLEVTKKLLGEPSVWSDIMKYGGYLKSAFSAGTAVFALIKFLDGIGKDSDMTALKKKLDEISNQLANIDKSIQQGFANLIEHMDFVQFRELVQNRIIAMFDLYTRCYNVKGKIPIEEFKKQCTDKQLPRNIFSDMFGFLQSDNNLIETHLKAKKYVYAVWEGWSNVFYNNAIKLIVMNMFYYGILCEEHRDAGNTDILIDEEEEIKDLIEQVRRMKDRLQDIENSRMKTFHKGGYAKEFLTEKFKSVKFQKNYNDLPNDSIPRIAYQMKKMWMNFNGPTDFYIMVIRGQQLDTSERYGGSRYAGVRIADSERVTVAANIGQASQRENDTFCVALIQPLTKEILEANDKVVKEHTDKLKDVVANAADTKLMLPQSILSKIDEKISSIPFKPLLTMYNLDQSQDDPTNGVKVLPINYFMVSETWSNPGGPLPKKYFWVCRQPKWFDCRCQLQFVFQ